ncbi:MAG: Cna B-type domain-containing protein, partial [Christensenellaceae bacterium]|nr:Cna B-type domain-containing protein [Christensenellaceae bacterium]
TQRVRKIWSDNAPTDKPTVVFRLLRKTALMADYEVVPEIQPGDNTRTLPNGSDTVHWTDLPATDEQGNAYSYSVEEGQFNAAGEFIHLIPENYRAELRVVALYDGAGHENGTELVVTNNWQETSFTAKKTWSDDAPTLKPDVELVLRQNGELYETAGEPRLLHDGETEVTWEHLPLYYYKEVNGVIEECAYDYSVDEIHVPESYDKIIVSETEILNDYHPVMLEARKSFDLSLAMPEFAGEKLLPETVRFSLYKTTWDAATGVTSMRKYDEVVVDGMVDDQITDGGEVQEWLYIWKRLPKYYDVIDEHGNHSRRENEFRIVEEWIPQNYELLETKDVSEADALRWNVSNRYRNGFTAHKVWDIGDRTAASLGGLPPVSIQLYRGIVLEDGTRIETDIWSEIVGEPVTLNGVADENILGQSRETTQENSLIWTYTWFDLEIYGAFPDARLTDYGIAAGDRVKYFYYVEEERGTTGPDGFSLDVLSSTSDTLVNRLDKTSFRAEKRWRNGPVDTRPAVEFVLYADYLDPATGMKTEPVRVGSITLDGVADMEGEVAGWD